jgi:hypothetical protein
MNTSNKSKPIASEVGFTGDKLRVWLADGREVSVPVSWFPRLAKASASQRKQWRLIGGGIGIHWPALDEDISVPNLLAPASSVRMARHKPVSKAAARSVAGQPRSGVGNIVEMFVSSYHASQSDLIHLSTSVGTLGVHSPVICPARSGDSKRPASATIWSDGRITRSNVGYISQEPVGFGALDGRKQAV